MGLIAFLVYPTLKIACVTGVTFLFTSLAVLAASGDFDLLAGSFVLVYSKSREQTNLRCCTNGFITGLNFRPIRYIANKLDQSLLLNILLRVLTAEAFKPSRPSSLEPKFWPLAMSSADGVVRSSASVGGGLGGDPNLYILIVVVLVSAVTFVCSGTDFILLSRNFPRNWNCNVNSRL